MMQKHDTAKLAKLSGAEFDKAYIDMMVKDHKKDVAEFEKESKGAKDSDLKSWASTTLPTLQDHLEDGAGHLDSTVGGKRASKGMKSLGRSPVAGAVPRGPPLLLPLPRLQSPA